MITKLAINPDWPKELPTPGIDWDQFHNYDHEPSELECRCDRVSFGHAKIVFVQSYTPTGALYPRAAGMRLVSEKPCPGCGLRDNYRRASSGPEKITIRKDDVGKAGQ